MLKVYILNQEGFTIVDAFTILGAIGSLGAVVFSLWITLKDKSSMRIQVNFYKSWIQSNNERKKEEHSISIDIYNTGEEVLYIKDVLIAKASDFPELVEGECTKQFNQQKYLDLVDISAVLVNENPRKEFILPNGYETLNVSSSSVKMSFGFSPVQEIIVFVINGKGEVYCSKKINISSIYFTK